MAAEGKDPLGYFAAYGSGSSSSDSSDSESAGPAGAPGPGGEGPGPGGGSPGRRPRLPPPDELFRKVSQPPAFLSNPLQRHIDWDRRVLRAPEEVRGRGRGKLWAGPAASPLGPLLTEEVAPPGPVLPPPPAPCVCWFPSLPRAVPVPAEAAGWRGLS